MFQSPKDSGTLSMSCLLVKCVELCWKAWLGLQDLRYHETKLPKVGHLHSSTSSNLTFGECYDRLLMLWSTKREIGYLFVVVDQFNKMHILDAWLQFQLEWQTSYSFFMYRCILDCQGVPSLIGTHPSWLIFCVLCKQFTLCWADCLSFAAYRWTNGGRQSPTVSLVEKV